jgi:lipoprotein-releasing system permease protein
LKDGVDPDKGLAAIEKLVADFGNQYPFELALPDDPLRAESWGERQGEFLSAVEKEKVLLTFLFGIISIVAVFLVFCIFFMIVVEKTRDIGIIKSVGASNAGVAQIFLGYGLLIGVMGAGIGIAVCVSDCPQHQPVARLVGARDGRCHLGPQRPTPSTPFPTRWTRMT